MLGVTLLTLATAACVSGARSKRELASRQAPSLPSDLSYINATRNDRTPVTLQIQTIDTNARNDTSPYMYGLMFEDISHSGDGGIYAEMITNRAFQGRLSFFFK